MFLAEKAKVEKLQRVVGKDWGKYRIPQKKEVIKSKKVKKCEEKLKEKIKVREEVKEISNLEEKYRYLQTKLLEAGKNIPTHDRVTHVRLNLEERVKLMRKMCKNLEVKAKREKRQALKE